MAKTVSEMSISLDGFITGPDDKAEQGLGRGGEVLHEWIFRNPGTFDEIIAAARADTGCLLTGRHSYEVAGGWARSRRSRCRSSCSRTGRRRRSPRKAAP